MIPEDIILDVKQLSVNFSGQVIFKNLTFQIKRGETAAIIGPNGAGKTMLFRALIGSVPFSGTVSFEPGVTIGYVPQRFDLDRYLTLNLGDFLTLKAKVLGLSVNSVEEVLRLVHLSPSKRRLPLSSLSGGELQRVLIAFALIGSPTVLLFDEPTAGVDLPGEEKIYQTLHDLQDEKSLTLIFISHDLNLVYRYAHKVICLNKALFCMGTPEETLKPHVLDQLYGAKILHHLHQHD